MIKRYQASEKSSFDFKNSMFGKTEEKQGSLDFII
jgi:hypothetical protein